jgi:hypothetical protein
MHKVIDVKLTSIVSPICQTLIHEMTQQQGKKCQIEWLNKCTELLVVRLDGVLVGFVTFDVIDDIHIAVNSLHFRNLIKDHSLAEFWLSRYLKRYLRKNSYMHLLLVD